MIYLHFGVYMRGDRFVLSVEYTDGTKHTETS
jgi:hypothetical protein